MVSPSNPRLRVVPDHDYGEGKTREQEAADSADMLGWVLLATIIAVIFAAGILLLWLL